MTNGSTGSNAPHGHGPLGVGGSTNNHAHVAGFSNHFAGHNAPSNTTSNGNSHGGAGTIGGGGLSLTSNKAPKKLNPIKDSHGLAGLKSRGGELDAQQRRPDNRSLPPI